METIAVLGAGSWGATLANHLVKCGNQVNLWEFDQKEAARLSEMRTIPTKIPGLVLKDKINVYSDIKKAVYRCNIIVIVTPAKFCRTTCKLLAELKLKNKYFVSASKGIEEKTLLRMSQVIKETLEDKEIRGLAALSGPSHAEEVAFEKPTTLVSASEDDNTACFIQSVFMNPYLRIYTSSDIVGVECGGAFKNVIAIAAGICDGMDIGDNAKSALITRGLSEIMRLGTAMGAKPYTFSGLSGLGDLVVTCASSHSRNRKLGELLGQGIKLEDGLQVVSMVVEGVYTAKSILTLSKKYGIEMPISKEVCAVLFDGKKPEQAVRDLMIRDAKPEMESGLYE